MCEEKKPPLIEVKLMTNSVTFTDWYDFADYLKEQQEQRRIVIVRGWEYKR